MQIGDSTRCCNSLRIRTIGHCIDAGVGRLSLIHICQLMVSTNEGRKFFYYVYQYEASDLLGAWESSQIYVKWDKKKIDKAYSLSATEVTKDAEGDGYTIKMSLVGTPVVQYLNCLLYTSPAYHPAARGGNLPAPGPPYVGARFPRNPLMESPFCRKTHH